MRIYDIPYSGARVKPAAFCTEKNHPGVAASRVGEELMEALR
jgi:hypothetical protein